ncbi:MAG: 2-oxo acid dehydrogenase subunit E2 [Saprospiraceae bacterium]|jgi:2-oxoglutarate dehydrogenase E2 component (dihydrolipoamide succinyltransferase)|nr:2-oxo acid dehydrogenase subunit E2 [Saprospiraceae bacterium]MBL0026320.1 2-oxo acid dehydrogenase subunit E2 [Saprospiraceae bacterium]
MAQIELIMPKMGESITEATILKWLKKVGDVVQMDEIVLEIATDKVDSDVPAPVSGVLAQIFYGEESVVDVGKVIAIIATEGEKVVAASPTVIEDTPVEIPPEAIEITHRIEEVRQEAKAEIHAETTDEQRFYSPLVKNIAKEEKISEAELDTIPGTGANGRLTKQDLLTYVEQKQSFTLPDVTKSEIINAGKIAASSQATSLSGNIDIIEMDRMRKLIAEHMIMSKQTSAHVTSFVEADVTNMVLWRDKNKNAFKAKYGENITFTPLFIDAVVRAIKDYPMINISLEGNKILIKKDINIGMAAALPTGNLIVPVVKNADMLSMAGLARAVNDLAGRARENKLKPDEIKDGTFTLTNVGTFGNLMGTPIINQPQVAILATGAIVKKPAVLETEFGDVIAIRHLMFLSLSYDHRIVDGALGGAFLKRISDNMEKFDPNTSV